MNADTWYWFKLRPRHPCKSRRRKWRKCTSTYNLRDFCFLTFCTSQLKPQEHCFRFMLGVDFGLAFVFLNQVKGTGLVWFWSPLLLYLLCNSFSKELLTEQSASHCILCIAVQWRCSLLVQSVPLSPSPFFLQPSVCNCLHLCCQPDMYKV